MADRSPPNARPERASNARLSRADALLAGAIAIVALLVAALLTAYAAQASLHARTVETIAMARNVRDEAMSIAQALADVEAARRAATLTRESPAAADQAKADALAHVAVLQDYCTFDPELERIAQRIGDLVSADFALDNAAVSSQAMLAQSAVLRRELRGAMEALRNGVNDLNDDARIAEGSTRQLLDAIAIALGIFALLAAAIAGLALRRERDHWRRAHAATADAHTRAIASDLAKSRFLAVASHDMRQPLHALTLYLTALERRVETDEARGIVAKMDRAVHSMVGMFTGLLDLARLQAGVVTADMADVRLQDVVDLAITEYPTGEIESNVGDIRVHSDARLLARLLSNLISNAVRHGGGAARVEARTDGASAIITVEDDGPGISSADQERIFEEFERLDSRADGLGLGLPIARKLSELLDASLTIDSSEGRGARFILRLPQAQTAEAAPEDDTHDAHALRGVPMLVMDDDALAREAIAGLLTDLGAEVRACANGEEAEALLGDGYAPRILLLDLRIHGELNGLAIAESLSAKLDSSVRTIIVTGDTGPETLEALSASGHVWLIKPVQAQDLRAAAISQLRQN